VQQERIPNRKHAVIFAASPVIVSAVHHHQLRFRHPMKLDGQPHAFFLHISPPKHTVMRANTRNLGNVSKIKSSTLSTCAEGLDHSPHQLGGMLCIWLVLSVVVLDVFHDAQPKPLLLLFVSQFSNDAHTLTGLRKIKSQHLAHHKYCKIPGPTADNKFNRFERISH
jgi:hypothetical protein